MMIGVEGRYGAYQTKANHVVSLCQIYDHITVFTSCKLIYDQ